MKRALLAMLGICYHQFGFPTRRDDGQDWQTCRDCGKERLSLIQFGSRPPDYPAPRTTPLAAPVEDSRP